MHHIFRKWGRVGSTRIGGNKVEKLGRVKAIDEFRRLFEEKTGNSWEAWENKEDLEKQPGKFYLVDIVGAMQTLMCFLYSFPLLTEAAMKVEQLDFATLLSQNSPFFLWNCITFSLFMMNRTKTGPRAKALMSVGRRSVLKH